MSSFENREQAFEAKFAHDEEFRFLTNARRDKLFGHWAAAIMGLSPTEESALLAAVLAISDKRGHDQVLRDYIAARLSAAGHRMTDTALVEALEQCGRDARQQLIAHPPEHSEIV